MKFVSRSLTTLGTLAAASLTGCGTMPSAGMPAMSAATSSETDEAQVNAINSVARSRGVQVLWVNYPRKVVRPAAAAPGGAG
jgi:hypothetical protein